MTRSLELGSSEPTQLVKELAWDQGFFKFLNLQPCGDFYSYGCKGAVPMPYLYAIYIYIYNTYICIFIYIRYLEEVKNKEKEVSVLFFHIKKIVYLWKLFYFCFICKNCVTWPPIGAMEFEDIFIFSRYKLSRIHKIGFN